MNGNNINIPTLLGKIRVFLLNAFWIIPAMSAIGAIGTAWYVSTVEYTTPFRIGGLLTTSGPTGARDMVQMVASSSLTVATLVFSIMVVVLQVAGSQYSPRLPAQFLRDVTTQLVLGVFIFTFVYSLAIIRSIAADNDHVPNLAVTICFFLVICCVGAFIHFIHHIIHAMRVEKILRDIEVQTLESLHRVMERQTDSKMMMEPPEIPPRALPIRSEEVGTVQRIDGTDLVDLAHTHDVVICFTTHNGDGISSGTPFGWIWTCDPEEELPDIEKDIRPDLRSVFQVGHERTFQDDFGFGITQLVDIALRALSPAVNDPTTACMAMQSLESVLVELIKREVGIRAFADEDGTTRVIVPGMDFAAYLDDAVAPICEAAPSDRSVMKALLRMLTNVARATENERHKQALTEQIERVQRTSIRALADETDQRAIRAAAKEARRALTGRPPRLT
ncbi:DUF2254 domain-containing protein [Aestuariibius insulae]|uniref:DUF2254 domain-containing protein n=1 Tax=Aestuariibius insulae TaxID=2058287 RepID=UPI00345EDE0C